jgi:hypothetical protein
VDVTVVTVHVPEQQKQDRFEMGWGEVLWVGRKANGRLVSIMAETI